MHGDDDNLAALRVAQGRGTALDEYRARVFEPRRAAHQQERQQNLDTTPLGPEQYVRDIADDAWIKTFEEVWPDIAKHIAEANEQLRVDFQTEINLLRNTLTNVMGEQAKQRDVLEKYARCLETEIAELRGMVCGRPHEATASATPKLFLPDGSRLARGNGAHPST